MRKNIISWKVLLLFITVLFITEVGQTEVLYGSDYVSPETYAVNEADLIDYRYIAPPPKLDIDNLDNYRYTEVFQQEEVSEEVVAKTSKKSKKVKKQDDPEAYKRKLSYKVAKWWVDERYKREEPHHGVKHEIKIKAREEYERQQLEKEDISQEK